MIGFSASNGRALRRRVLAASLVLAASGASALDLTAEEGAGKRLYGQAQGLAGRPITARIGVANIPIQGAPVACGNCHAADGKGRPEAVVRPPDITWRELTKPYGHEHENGRRHRAFDERSLAAAVTRGVDPAGNRLDPAMPRYTLSEAELAKLVAYLKRLEFDRDPGIGDDVLRIGTVLPREGPRAQLGHAVESVLRAQLNILNAGGGVHGRRIELIVAALPPGESEARKRIRELMKENVFALVSPLAPGLESTLVEAAEAAGVPVVGLASLGADEGRGGRGVFRILPGLVEQGRALARFAVRDLRLEKRDVAVLYADVPALSAAAAAVQAELQRLRAPEAVTLAYPPGALVADEMLSRLRGRNVDAVFFFGADSDFATFARAAAAAGRSPYLLAAASHVARVALATPREFHERVFLAYPMLPGDGSPMGHAAFAVLRHAAGAASGHEAIQRAAYAACAVLIESVKRTGREASRSGLIQALENLYEFDTGVTPAVTFGPARRVGAAGAHVLAADLDGQRFHPVGGYVRLE